MKLHKYLGLLLLLVITFLKISNASAAVMFLDESNDERLKGMVNNSEFIFVGTLEKMTYKNSIEGIPYTFAQYSVDKIIKGQYYSNTIVLKFVGGYFDNDRKGNHLTVSNSPVLKENERSILMVTKNGSASCPLVGCEHGRLRLDNSQVLSANNAAMVIDDKKSLQYVSESARKSGKYRASLDSMNPERFIEHLRGLAQQSPARTYSLGQSVASADMDAPFNAAKALVSASLGPVANTATQSVPQYLQRSTGSDFDQWEEEQLRQNSGNPVLTEAYSN